VGAMANTSVKFLFTTVNTPWMATNYDVLVTHRKLYLTLALYNKTTLLSVTVTVICFEVLLNLFDISVF